ncbi:MAG TPA: hypothetical protein VMD27_06380 [Candidatus Aquilonibacter sp.]|nr:hypothetical protein [Candidatus Aquilonibacter sp.]
MVKAAKALRVSYSHLHGVVTGIRKSPALFAKFQKYQEQLDAAGHPLKTLPPTKNSTTPNKP